MNYRDEFDGLDGDHNISQRLDQVRRQVMIRTRGSAVDVRVLVVMALVLAAVVCDYIAGMTDRYAIREHERLFDLYWDMR